MALRALTLPVSGGLELNTDTQHSTNSEGLEVAQARVPPPAIDIQILEPKHTSKPLPALSLAGNSSADKLGIYPCAALTLPNELVAEIFLHFLPVYPKRPPPIGPLSPYLLCHICRGWREIALTTPALWRGISFSLRNVQQLPQKLHFLNTSLALSGSYPLSIRLDSDIEGESPLRIGPFGRTIIDHCARWELLQLSIPCPWDFLPNTAESVLLPFLRELKLRKNRDFRSAGFTSNRAILVAPLLEKVTIISYHQAYDPIIPWSQLTMLYIDFIRPDQCNILNQLVNLISCRLRMYRIGEDFPKIILPRVETFILHAVPSQIFAYALDAFTLPALQRLHHGKFMPRTIFDPVATLAALISRSGCTLQELCVPGSYDTEEDYRRCDEFSSVVSFNFDDSGELNIADPILKEWSNWDDGEDMESEERKHY